MYTVYIIKNNINKHYIGVTSDVNQRLRHHNSGANRSTKNKGPWTLAHEEYFDNKKDAWLREKQIKSYKGGEAFKKLLNNNGRVA